jgi:alkaline phosphatase D
MVSNVLLLRNRPGDYDAYGQDQAKVLARENEMVQILRTIKQNGIKNVVSITSDVHFSAAVKFNPDDAVFKDFNPFYEFVIGPIHAGAFGPGELEGTFGPSYEFRKSQLLLSLFYKEETYPAISHHYFCNCCY